MQVCDVVNGAVVSVCWENKVIVIQSVSGSEKADSFTTWHQTLVRSKIKFVLFVLFKVLLQLYHLYNIIISTQRWREKQDFWCDYVQAAAPSNRKRKDMETYFYKERK